MMGKEIGQLYKYNNDYYICKTADLDNKGKLTPAFVGIANSQNNKSCYKATLYNYTKDSHYKQKYFQNEPTADELYADGELLVSYELNKGTVFPKIIKPIDLKGQYDLFLDLSDSALTLGSDKNINIDINNGVTINNQQITLEQNKQEKIKQTLRFHKQFNIVVNLGTDSKPALYEAVQSGNYNAKQITLTYISDYESVDKGKITLKSIKENKEPYPANTVDFELIRRTTEQDERSVYETVAREGAPETEDEETEPKAGAPKSSSPKPDGKDNDEKMVDNKIVRDVVKYLADKKRMEIIEDKDKNNNEKYVILETDSTNNRYVTIDDYNDVVNYLICITQGYITTFAGQPGTGKTSLCCHLAAALGLDEKNLAAIRRLDAKTRAALLGLTKEKLTEMNSKGIVNEKALQVLDEGAQREDFVELFKRVHQLGYQKFYEAELAKRGYDSEQFIEISVERGWTSHKDFIGYYNPITKEIAASNQSMYDLFEKKFKKENAEEENNNDRPPYLVLLDEANLSPIEHYWAAFLRFCDTESNKELSLGGKETYVLPDRLHFLATVNFDHTTEELSPRFLDRTWVIYLDAPTLDTPPEDQTKKQKKNIVDKFADSISGEFKPQVTTDAGGNAANNETTRIPYSFNELKAVFGPHIKKDDKRFEKNKERFIDIAKVFQANEMPLSPRVCKMVLDYLAAACRLMEPQDSTDDLIPLDYAVSQKVLPTICGMGNEYKELINGKDEQGNVTAKKAGLINIADGKYKTDDKGELIFDGDGKNKILKKTLKRLERMKEAAEKNNDYYQFFVK